MAASLGEELQGDRRLENTRLLSTLSEVAVTGFPNRNRIERPGTRIVCRVDISGRLEQGYPKRRLVAKGDYMFWPYTRPKIG